MATASTIVYCTDRDVFDIYPRVSQYDYKTRLPNRWSKSGNKYTIEGFKFIEDESGLVGANRIIQLYANGEDLLSPEEGIGQLNTTGEWFMQLTVPRIIYYNSSDNPNNMIMELGEDRTNLMLRFRKKASRIIESFLGSIISREIIKDREGNYPTSIIQATALKSVILFISAYNPNNPDLIPLNEEYGDIMGKIKAGKIVMTGHRSSDDSKGTIREVALAVLGGNFITFGRLKPVELKGNYLGSEYELLKVAITSSSAQTLGVATFSVWGKSNTNLKQKLLVEDEIINGDYQSLGLNNLQIRFGGKYMTSTEVDGTTYQSMAFSNDEWEIELWGNNIQPSVSQINSVLMSRRSELWQ